MVSDDPRLALLCARQSARSTIVGLKAADVVRQGGLAVAVSPSMRQSGLLYQKIRRALFSGEAQFARATAVELELANGGLAISLPGDRPDMLRGLSLRWPKTSLLLHRRGEQGEGEHVAGGLADAGQRAAGAADPALDAGRRRQRVPPGHDERRRRLAARHGDGRACSRIRPTSSPARRSGSARRCSLRSTSANSFHRRAAYLAPMCSAACSETYRSGRR